MRQTAFRLAAVTMLVTAGAILPAAANNQWYVECKKTCKTCGEDALCKPGVTTYTVGQTYDSQEAAQAAAKKENLANLGANCTVKEVQSTAGNGGQALEQPPGVTTLNYKREGIVFDGAGPDSVKSEVIGNVRKARQLSTLHTTVEYKDTVDGKGYQVAQYLTSQLPVAGADGIRSIPADVQPISVTVYRNPDGDANSTAGRLDVVHQQRHPQSGEWVTTTIRLTAPQGNNQWKREWFIGDPAQDLSLSPYRSIEVVRNPHVDGTETVRETTKDLTSNGALVVTKDQTLKYGFYKYGCPAILEQTDHTGTGSELTSSWTYYTSRSDQASFNKPKTLRRNDGQWANYTYSGSPVTGIVITRTVSGWLDNPAPALDQAADENANRLVTEIEAYQETGSFSREERVQGVLVFKTWGERYKDNARQLVEKSRVETGTSTLLTTRTGYPDDESATEAERGRLKSIEAPDGTIELHRYQMQGENLVETVDKGAGSLSEVTSGKRSISTFTKQDVLIKEVIVDIASGVEFSAREAIALDANGKVTRWALNHDNEDYAETIYGCCGVESERSRDGIVTSYTRDALKRPLTEVSQGVTLTYIYGAKNDFPTVTRVKTAGDLTQQLGTEVMDHTGNVIERITADLDGDNQDEVTTTSHNIATRTTITTYPDGGTEIDVNYADGQSKSSSGTAVAPAAWTYTTHGEQGGGLVTTSFAGTASSTRWLKSYLNLSGETLKPTVPSANGELAIVTNAFDELGRIIRTSDADGVTQLHAYNPEGERFRTALDLNQNGQIDNSDRVTDIIQDMVADSVIGAAARTRRVVYDPSNNPVTVSTRLESVDGLKTRNESLSGGVSQTIAADAADHLDGAWSDTAIAPDGTKSIVTYASWRPVTRANLATNNQTIESASTGFDALGRVISQNDSRKAAAVTVRTTYGSAGQVASVTEDLSIGTDRTTGYAYDSMGRVVEITLPDGGKRFANYWPTGQVKAEWGSQTCPTMKLYSSQGEQVELRTYRGLDVEATQSASLNLEVETTFDATKWHFNNRGQLQRKEHADGKGPAYTYTPGGRLQTRTGGRGIVTTYGYSTAGELSTTDYSDATPDVAIVHDKLGRRLSITNGVATSDFTYTPNTLALDYETISYDLNGDSTVDFTRVLDRTQDTLGRSTGFQLKHDSTIENEAAYTYSATSGRLATVAGTSSPGAFTYSYTPGSSLVASVTGVVHTVSNTWDATRNALDLKENKVGTAVVSSYDYTVNAVGQRTGVAQVGSAFAADRSIAWGYDSLGQVTSANHTDTPFDRAYQYDAIGNRIEARNGAISVTGTPNYAANELNQYETIGSLSPLHDDEGNATNYPLPEDPGNLSTLAWDAENRLISATVDGTTVSYLYDSQSRRVARRFGSDTTVYLCDGWNVVAEYATSDLDTFELCRTLLWGSDLSGTPQGAGGVGGLLAIKSGGAVHYPTFDGNGNISEYLDSSGSVAAHFEYDPFGNTVVNTDTEGAFPYRFSTKPIDAETGLYYYGYRYYDPMTGRWPSRDPLDEAAGTNLLAFGTNSPISGWDDLGNSWYDSLVDTAKEKINEVGQTLSSAKDSAVQAAKSKIDSYIAKAKSGALSISWRKGGKLILWSTKAPVDFEVSADYAYGVNVKSGSQSSKFVRGELFFNGTGRGRYKSPRISKLAFANVMIGGGVNAQLNLPYCYNKETGDVIFEDPNGIFSVFIRAGLRWETGWYGASWFNDHWGTNNYVEAMATMSWRWRLPDFAYMDNRIGFSVRAVTEKRQEWDKNPLDVYDPTKISSNSVHVTEHFRISWGDSGPFN